MREGVLRLVLEIPVCGVFGAVGSRGLVFILDKHRLVSGGIVAHFVDEMR